MRNEGGEEQIITTTAVVKIHGGSLSKRGGMVRKIHGYGTMGGVMVRDYNVQSTDIPIPFPRGLNG